MAKNDLVIELSANEPEPLRRETTLLVVAKRIGVPVKVRLVIPDVMSLSLETREELMRYLDEHHLNWWMEDSIEEEQG